MKVAGMSRIALALVDAFMFFELSDESVLHPDDALRMSESMLSTLDACSNEEFACFEEAAKQRLAEEIAGLSREDVIAFLSKLDRSMLPRL
ncbi:MAG: hypothetical protein C0485_00315 [Pirellula sp.]|nr:hypothetical protein [Pirellula sp.]